MIDLGVVRPGSTIRIPFSTYKGSDGSSITMTNFAAADILVYKDGSTTERASTSGYTATTDFDAKTGDHVAIIDLSDNTTSGFWSAGSEYLVAIDAVTVDGVTTGGWIARFRIGQRAAIFDTTIATLSSQTSFTLTVGPAEDNALVGMWVLIHDIASAVQMSWAVISAYTGSTKTVTLAAAPTFTIAAGDNISVMDRMPLQPTTFGRTLDVSSTGEAGVDWANVGSQSTTVTLSGTTVKTATDVETDTANIQTRLPAALVSGRIDASVGAMAADVITSTALAASAVTEIQSGLSTLDAAGVRTAVGLASANLDTQIATLATAANLATVAGYIDTEIGTIITQTTAASIRSAVGLASANLDTQISALATASALASLVTTVGVAGAGLTGIPKTGYKLASDGLDLIIPDDPSAAPVLGTATLPQWIAYFGAWSVNEINSDSNSVDLRNSADSGNLASYPVSDDGTTFTISEPA